MIKKLYVSVLIAILAGLTLSSLAFAQIPPALHGGRRGVGKIVSIGTNELAIEARRGDEYTILVDETTEYRTYDGEEIGYGDLQIGQWVAGILRFNEQDEMVARLVILLQEDYDPSQRLGRRARGQVTGVDPATDTFTLRSLSGEDLTFKVASGTIYRGGVERLEDLEPGMVAAIGATKQEDGSLLALVVMARKTLVRQAGKVTEVNIPAGTFTVQTLGGETVTIHVDENTQFHSRDGSIQSLDDLQPGMAVFVAAREGEDGELIARRVAAGLRKTP